MSDIYVSYHKVSSANEGYKLASQILQGEEAKSKFPVKIDFSFIDGPEPKVIGTGKGFEVTLRFSESKVFVELNLKLMLKPLRGRILDSLTDEIKRIL